MQGGINSEELGIFVVSAVGRDTEIPTVFPPWSGGYTGTSRTEGDLGSRRQAISP